MPPRDWTFRIRDIRESVGLIQGYVRGMDFRKFAADRKTVDAVIRNLAVIGEAANHVPEEVRSRHPDIPWDDMRGMRNVIVHAYFGVELADVWRTIQEDLPTLKAQLDALSKNAGL